PRVTSSIMHLVTGSEKLADGHRYRRSPNCGQDCRKGAQPIQATAAGGLCSRSIARSDCASSWDDLADVCDVFRLVASNPNEPRAVKAFDGPCSGHGSFTVVISRVLHTVPANVLLIDRHHAAVADDARKGERPNDVGTRPLKSTLLERDLQIRHGLPTIEALLPPTLTATSPCANLIHS